MHNLDNSIHFDYRLFPLESENTPSPLRRFVDDIFPSLDLPAKNKRTKDKKNAITNILSNVLYAHNSSKYVAIGLSAGSFKIPGIYGMSHFSYSFISNGIKSLEKMLLITKHSGFHARNTSAQAGRKTRISASNGLLQSISHYSEDKNNAEENWLRVIGTLRIDQLKFTRIPYKRSFILNRRVTGSKNKELMHYDLTPALLEQLNQLDVYNRYMSKCTVELVLNQDPPIDTIPLPLYITSKRTHNGSISHVLNTHTNRVFSNGSFDQGGRFYSYGYQGLPEEIRKNIILNGEHTVEIDYSALHPRMLYHLKGIDYLNDPYSIPNLPSDMRAFIKSLFNIALNSKNQTSALRAFYDDMRVSSMTKNKDKKRLKRQQFDSFLIPASKLLSIIVEFHPSINEYLFSGVGLNLQNLDSRIANDILYDFALREKPCLCVHDSFIVRVSDKELLESLMIKYYRNHLGDYTVILKASGEVKIFYPESLRKSA